MSHFENALLAALPQPLICQTLHGSIPHELGAFVHLQLARVRPLNPMLLADCIKALHQQNRLGFTYHNRYDQSQTQRQISPQRLNFYREGWYLDAWDHQRNAMRTFALELVQGLQILNKNSVKLPDDKLKEYFEAAYGIFSGPAKFTAEVIFYGQTARLMQHTLWHPAQVGNWQEEQQSYHLQIPYADEREILKDLSSFAAEVEVISPASLRQGLYDWLYQGLVRNRS